MSLLQNLIIGAGPSGLAIAGRLKQLSLPFVLLEKSQQVGNEWINHYDRLHLHTDKKYSALPFLPFPTSYPTFIPKQKLIEYFEDYVRHFNIEVQFNQEVVKISKEVEHWRVKTKTDEFIAENVIVGTGYNRIPKIPKWQNMDEFKGEILHSSQYKNGKRFVGKNVLVVGYGNSGAEIALDLCESGAKTFISIRSPLNVVKRDFLGIPTQRIAIFCNQFGENFYHSMTRMFKQLSVNEMKKAGLPISSLAPSEQLTKLGKVPVIDVGTLAEIKLGNIKILPDILSFSKDSIQFENGQSLFFDAVILSTGFHAHLTDFFDNIQPLLSERGYPTHLWSDLPAYQGLYFIGFNTPVTGIIWDIYKSSEKIVERIRRSHP